MCGKVAIRGQRTCDQATTIMNAHEKYWHQPNYNQCFASTSVGHRSRKTIKQVHCITCSLLIFNKLRNKKVTSTSNTLYSFQYVQVQSHDFAKNTVYIEWISLSICFQVVDYEDDEMSLLGKKWLHEQRCLLSYAALFISFNMETHQLESTYGGSYQTTTTWRSEIHKNTTRHSTSLCTFSAN